MILGYNPATISSIYYTRAWRVGHHPSYKKLMKRKHPILYFLGKWDGGILEGMFFSANVIIKGSNGNDLTRIPMGSNKKAKELSDRLNKELAEWVAKK